MDKFQSAFASLARARIVHNVHLSAAFLFFYDHLTTFSAEVEFVWPARWGAGKVLFFAARYPAWPELLLTLYIELFDVRPQACHAIFTYMSWSTVLGIAASEMILVLRTWAIWNGMRSMLLALVLMLLAVLITAGYLVAFYIKESSFISASSMVPGLTGCVLRSSTHRVAAAWITFTAFELVIVVMTLIKGLEHFKHCSSNLLTSLYCDGILYFLCLLAISVANVTVLYTTPAEYIVLLSVMQRSFHSIFACRIILHLQAASAGRAEATSLEIYTGTLLHGGSHTLTQRTSVRPGNAPYVPELESPLTPETPIKVEYI